MAQSTRPLDEHWTNDIMAKILSDQKAARISLATQLEASRDKNLRREFEAFKASGGTLPTYVPTVESPGKRFSTTSNEYTTQEQFSQMPPLASLRKSAKDRKMANWTAQIDFGSAKIEYVTDARRNGASGVDKEGFRESMKETMKSRNRAKELKKNLTRTQWQLGQDNRSLEDAKSTSILPDPRGTAFNSYRGVLNKDVEHKIRRSVAFEGCLDPNFAKPNYTTVMQEGSRHHGNTNDFAAIKQNAKRLKRELGNSQISFGDGQFRGLTTDYREGFKSYSSAAMDDSKGRMDPNLLKQLRASSIEFGDGKEREMRTDSQRSNEFLMKALDERKGGNGVDSMLEAVSKDNRRIKERLSKTTYRIGNDRDYMH